MARIFMRFPGGKKKALTLSYDDGVEQDARLLAIMRKFGLKGTFNLNSGLYGREQILYPYNVIHRRMSRTRINEVFLESGMEIAVHGFTHANMQQLSANLCTVEVTNDRLNLEKQFHRLVRGMAYAEGSYNDEVISCLKCCGIAYARTTVSTGDFRLPSDWYRLTATCHHRDERLMEFAHKFIEEEVRKNSWLFYLWGHSYEFDLDNNWERIEEFSEYVGGRAGVWYATNIEIHDYIEAYHKLIFSMNGAKVYNPTALEIFFEIDGQNVQIAPGETVQIPCM